VCTLCDASRATFHIPHITCHVLHATCHMPHASLRVGQNSVLWAQSCLHCAPGPNAEQDVTTGGLLCRMSSLAGAADVISCAQSEGHFLRSRLLAMDALLRIAGHVDLQQCHAVGTQKMQLVPHLEHRECRTPVPHTRSFLIHDLIICGPHIIPVLAEVSLCKPNWL